ncbi:SLBB domain-containing protein, partial [Leucobacter soli]|uniref:SLBB domain-containing protein n=1 Tax=Leucobacter soli TaxID=2812850 RepID=UPI00360F426D
MSTLYRPEGRTEDGAEERASGRLAPWSPNDAGSRRLWGPYPGEEPPVPLDWRPPPRFRDRVLAAVGVPAAVGTVLFALAVGAVVVIALLRSHVPDTGGEAETAQFGSEGAAESDGAGLLPGATDDPASVGASDGSAAAMVLVHVVGKVREPGVVELPSGARVQDAIEAAGGATSSAALSRLNLARPVLDGEQIAVSTRAGSGAAGSGGSDAAGGD